MMGSIGQFTSFVVSLRFLSLLRWVGSSNVRFFNCCIPASSRIDSKVFCLLVRKGYREGEISHQVQDREHAPYLTGILNIDNKTHCWETTWFEILIIHIIGMKHLTRLDIILSPISYLNLYC